MSKYCVQYQNSMQVVSIESQQHHTQLYNNRELNLTGQKLNSYTPGPSRLARSRITEALSIIPINSE